MFVLFKVLGWDPTTGKFNPTGYVRDLVGPDSNVVARVTVLFIVITVVFFGLLTALSGKRWAKLESSHSKPKTPHKP